MYGMTSPRATTDSSRSGSLLDEPCEDASAESILTWAVDRFAPRIAIASSFSVEDTVVIDLATRILPGIAVFTIDTGYHFTETEEVKARITSKYQLNLVEYHPELSIPQQTAQYGEALYRRDPDHCCSLRKVEPLTRALQDLDAWVTGLRSEQSPTRRDLHIIEQGDLNGRPLYKINPLAHWTRGHVWQYVQDHQLPYNTLYDQGYPSIGCVHCTRPVDPGADPRSGRWAGTEKQECGIHTFMSTPER
jgi:phosphoadenosine phosphosulfate reductase